MENIGYYDAVRSGAFFVDVRSPGEYDLDHIPGSLNIPIFDNIERHDVGLIFNSEGRDVAIEKGYSILLEKVEKFVKDFQDISLKYNTVVVYCFRGGLRSQTVVKLLEGVGIKVLKLSGGYKRYRHHVNEYFSNLELNQNIVVVTGNTGSGKTKLIKQYESAVNLEGLASHRNSAFGSLGLKPVGQKMFDSLLMNRLLELSDSNYLLFEYEASKIGDIIIPKQLAKLIRRGCFVKFNLPIEFRVSVTKDEYENHLRSDKDRVVRIIESIEKKIHVSKKKLIAYLENDDYDSFIRDMLIHYYDIVYANSIEKIEMKYEFNCADLNECKEKLDYILI